MGRDAGPIGGAVRRRHLPRWRHHHFGVGDHRIIGIIASSASVALTDRASMVSMSFEHVIQTGLLAGVGFDAVLQFLLHEADCHAQVGAVSALRTAANCWPIFRQSSPSSTIR